MTSIFKICIFLLVAVTATNFQVNAIPYPKQSKAGPESRVEPVGNAAEPSLKKGGDAAVKNSKEGDSDLGLQEDDDDDATTSKYGGPGKPQLFNQIDNLLKVIFTGSQAVASPVQGVFNYFRGTNSTEKAKAKPGQSAQKEAAVQQQQPAAGQVQAVAPQVQQQQLVQSQVQPQVQPYPQQVVPAPQVIPAQVQGPAQRPVAPVNYEEVEVEEISSTSESDADAESSQEESTAGAAGENEEEADTN